MICHTKALQVIIPGVIIEEQFVQVTILQVKVN